jgi:hypothetical protein
VERTDDTNRLCAKLSFVGDALLADVPTMHSVPVRPNGGILMKSERSTPSKIGLDAILASRYLELQELRDKVRKAEASCPSQRFKKTMGRKPLAIAETVTAVPEPL